MAERKKPKVDTPGTTSQDLADILPVHTEQEVVADVNPQDIFHEEEPGVQHDAADPGNILLDKLYPPELGPMLAHFTPEEVDLDSIYDDPSNARTHSPRNLEAVMNSLRMFGQVEPLLVQASTRRIIGGHGRKEAMQAMGWTRCIVIFLPLNDVQATALAIALNRTAELADWDYDALTKQLKALESEHVDLQLLGWEAFDIQPLFAANFVPAAADGSTTSGGDGSEGGSGKPGDEGDNANNAKPIHVTPNMRLVIDPAISEVRFSQADAEMTEGKCIELICADFMAGRPTEAQRAAQQEAEAQDSQNAE